MTLKQEKDYCNIKEHYMVNAEKLFFIRFLFLFMAVVTGMNSLNAQALFQGLSHPVNSRGWAMGEAVSTLNSDGTGILFNPAALSNAAPSLQLSMTNFVLGIHSTNACAVFDSKIGKIGAAMKYLDYGAFTERDKYGTDIGEFRVNDYYFNLVYGRSISRHLNLGFSAGLANSELNSLSSRAIIGSIGLLYFEKKSSLSIGLSYNNFGKITKTYISNESPLYGGFILGVSKHLEHLPMIISSDICQVQKDEYIVKVGGEFDFRDMFFLRWGMTTKGWQLNTVQNFSSFFAGTSLGMGLKLGKMAIDLAVVTLGDAGQITSFTLSRDH